MNQKAHKPLRRTDLEEKSATNAQITNIEVNN